METKTDKKSNQLITPAILILIAANIFIWRSVAFSADSGKTQLYFLSVGQGDSELVVLPGNVKILIDGGPPNGMVLDELGKILPPFDRYIDLVILSHPHLDHYGGLIDVLKSYQVGAIIDNGNSAPISAYADFVNAINKNGAKHLVLEEGDAIKYGDARFDVISPNAKDLASSVVHDGCIVMMFREKGLRALYTGDIGRDTEDELIQRYNLSAQILKVGHHGSKTSSSPEFLRAVHPQFSVIEAGLHNTYGHPTKRTLENLADIGAQIFRTDQGGTVKFIFDGGNLKVFN